MDFISNFIKRPMSLVLSDPVNVLTSNENNQNESQKNENKSNENERKERQEQQLQHSPINTKASVDVDAAHKSNLTLSAANARPRLTMPNFTEAVIEQLTTSSAAGTANSEANPMKNDTEKPTENVGNTTIGSKRVSSRFIDLAHYDESDIPDLPNNVSLELGEDPLRLTFNEGNTIDFERGDVTLDLNYLQLPNNDIDTAVSSDNEVYAECLSYRDSELNFELATETSDTEHYRSALNSTENKVHNEAGSLNTTMENENEQHSDEVKTPLQQSKTSISGSQISECEPMDVDMNSTLEMSSYSNNSTVPVDDMFGKQMMLQRDPTPEKITESYNVQSNGPCNENITLPVQTSAESIHRVPGKNEEVKEGKSENIGDNIETIGNGPHENSASKDCHIDAERAVETSNISAPESKEELNLTVPLANELKEELNSIVPPAEGNLSTLNTSITLEEKDKKLSLIVDSVLSANIISPKQSGEISPNFPIKTITEKSKFPSSPNGLSSDRPPTFLEPSEYTEHVCTQAEKSPEPISIQVTNASPNEDKSPIVINAEKRINSIASISPTVSIASTIDNSPAGNSTINISDEVSPVSSHNATFEASCNISPQSVSPAQTPVELPVTTTAEKRRTFNVDSLSSQIQHQHILDNLNLTSKPENNRRTFTFSPLHEGDNRSMLPNIISNEHDNMNNKRLTFNLSAFEAGSPSEFKTSSEEKFFNQQLNISCEAMDVDESFSRLENSSGNSPVHQSQQHHTTTMALADMKLLSPSATNPMSMLANRPTICSTATAAAAQILSQSPPLPTLRKSSSVEDALKMPPPPPTATSPRLNKKRNSTPMNNGDANLSEALSAKEQTKSNSKDEKDIFVEKFTPSPVEEIFASSSSSTNPFGSSAIAAQLCGTEQFKFGFNDSDFLSGTNLILQPSDIDFLLTKGSNNEPIDRSSLLLRFDPLLGLPVPVNATQQQQQALQKLLQKVDTAGAGGTRLLGSSTSSNDRNFLKATIDEADQLVESQGENNCAKADPSLIRNQQQQQNQHTEQQKVSSKKNANMSVDVIKDINIDNDCTKSYEHTNTQSDEKQANFKMDELEKKIKNEVLKTEDIEKKLKEGEQREEALIKRITEKDKTISKMNGVIEAYEKAIAELIAEKEKLTQNFEQQLAELRADRDSNYHHLTSLETTFSDLHVKYEKSKEMTLQLKSNEESLLSKIQQTMENLRSQEQRYDKMKNHAMMQLEIANKKLESMEKAHAVETTKLKAHLKKEEISRASINEQLQQKSRENEELVKICDELINGQGS